MRKLFVYPNLSMGGVSAVLRGRAASEPQTHFDAVFNSDKGGSLAFRNHPNITTIVVPKGRMGNYLGSVVNDVSYDEISILSDPDTANALSKLEKTAIRYEFHSSNMSIVKSEIARLEFDRIAEISTPSQMMLDKIRQELPRRVWSRLAVVPNLVDAITFSAEGRADFFDHSRLRIEGEIPLVWIGRFDKDKAVSHFLRLLSQLPEQFVGHVLVSLEDDPSRAERFYGECAELGIHNRIRLYQNFAPEAVANLFRSTRDSGGWLVSTSLNESFGYSVAEATSVGLRVVASDLPVWDLFQDSGLVNRTPCGSVSAMAALLSLTTTG